jgi:N-acetylated-alpha-linked acidic dipeptidase
MHGLFRRALPTLLAAGVTATLGLRVASSATSSAPSAAPASAPSPGTVTPAAAAPAGPAVPPLLGFSEAGAGEERLREARFDSQLDPQELRAWMQRLSARPHHLGSPYDKQNAEFIAGLYRGWGFETGIEEFRVLFPTPKERRLEMVAPTPFTAALAEPAIPEDATSGQQSEQLPVYNAYSIDGDVTGDLVYVNYGVPDDYEELARRGIDVKGKVVIARYGGSWRGIKPKVAAEHGAVGCIIYSDPREDGYFAGDVYPRGGWRNEHAAQRGSVADMPLYAGDPLTPGVGATPHAKRLAIKDAPTLTKIPVLPIAYADALPLLRALVGPIAPPEWRGALPIPYHLGPGAARVHLKVAFNWDLVPAYDVIAKLRGAERPDEWVVRGNHYDAWVNGATDPLSGQVAELAEAKALAALVKGGWRPKRTIVYAAWDGEEPGLLGSTEWVETHAGELRDKAVVYINSDTNERGFLQVGGSHTLERFINQVARDVTDPEKKISVLERRRAALIMRGDAAERREARGGDLRIAALGSGSDYSPFLQHLGIASLNLGYGGEAQYGQYHSVYDSFDHFVRFVDPTFAYGIALAQTAGHAVLRLASAEVLPFDFTRFSDTVGRYVKEVSELADRLREETAERNRRIEDKVFEAVADPLETWVTPRPQDPVPHVNFAPLENARDRLERSARDFQKALDAVHGGTALAPSTRRALDEVMLKSERALAGSGLPRRPWYVHQIYAPGYYTGYGVKTLPGVREALEQRNWKEADEQVAVTARIVEAFAAEVDRGAAILKRAEAGK